MGTNYCCNTRGSVQRGTTARNTAPNAQRGTNTTVCENGALPVFTAMLQMFKGKYLLLHMEEVIQETLAFFLYIVHSIVQDASDPEPVSA